MRDADGDTDEAAIHVESHGGTTVIEVADADRAADIVKDLLSALGPSLEAAERIYVELDARGTAAVDADADAEESADGSATVGRGDAATPLTAMAEPRIDYDTSELPYMDAAEKPQSPRAEAADDAEAEANTETVSASGSSSMLRYPGALQRQREREAEADADADDDADDDESMAEFDGKEISAGTSIHAVAAILREEGPLLANELIEAVEEYAEGTVYSALSNGKRDRIFENEEPDGEGSSTWSLTDWGYEQARAVGPFKGRGRND